MLDNYDISLINNILFLSGSGLDAESGIQTFRAADGLWAGHDVYSVCSATAFKNDPDTVYSFYNKRRRELKSVKPNQAHYSLVDLEKEFEVNIVTQNISGLHKKAGSTKVIELHGSLKKSFCLDNNHTFDWEGDLNASDLCPICQSQMRMGIVMFEENVYHLDEVQNLANKADLFVSTGTSLNVFPANALIDFFKKNNKPTIEINLERTVKSDLFDYGIYDKPATQSITEFKDLLIKKKREK